MQFLFRIAVVMQLFSFIGNESFGQNKFIISGKVPEIYNGVEIKLSSENRLFHPYITKAQGGQFQFSGEMNEKYEYVSLSVTRDDKIIGGTQFFIGATNMEIDILHLNAENGQNDFKFRNVPFITEQRKYEGLVKPIEDSLSSTSNLLWLVGKKVRTGFDKDSLNAVIKSLKSDLLNRKLKFIKAIPDKYIALYIFNSQIINNIEISPDSLISIYSAFDTSLKQTNLGQLVYSHLYRKKSLLINGIPPDFSFSTNDGQHIQLSSFHNKNYVLLCFWSSWCGPCIRTIPLLQNLHKQYAGKGLQMISISIDNEEMKWLNALKMHEMPWLQACDLPAFIKGQQVRFLYDINFIPQYFLIDKQGKLVYHNIQLKDNDNYNILQKTLKELLQ